MTAPILAERNLRSEQADRPSIDSIPLGERLYQAGLITAEELATALGRQHVHRSKLGETLLELGFIDEETLLRFLGSQLDLPAVRLRDGLIDPNVVQLLPRSKAEQMSVIAMFQVRDTLAVAMAEPNNLRHLDEIERITSLRVRPVLALRSNIQSVIPRCYEDNYVVDAVTADLAPGSVQLHEDTIDIELASEESLADGSPIVNLVNYMIVCALRQKASDIHLEPGVRHSTLRLRVDGLLREAIRPRAEYHAALVSRIKVMAKLDIAESRQPQDGRFHAVVDGREIDLRVSTLPTILGEKVVIRVLDRRRVTFDLDSLGVPPPLLTKMKTMLARPHGLILVTGPTGSGKTTTLYSAIELIKSVHHNIVTVEDPVEYQLDQINQVPVGTSKSMTFANALRAILRQDPDVIMVGEIRDAETASVAVQAALTGHLVLSTLHTNDSFSAVVRLADMGIEKFKIAASLVGVISQRLVRCICPHCRTMYYPPNELLDAVRYRGDRRRQFVRGEGCRACHDTGHSGRVGAYEVLAIDRELRTIIANGGGFHEIQDCHIAQGGSLILEEGLRLAEDSKTSLEEVLRLASSD